MCPNYKNSGEYPQHLEIFKNITEEQKYLARYKMEAMMYLIKNIEEIKHKYAEYIYEQLCLQEPKMRKPIYSELELGSAKSKGIKLISTFIKQCNDMLVLCHPENGEPCVVEDAYIFTKYDIESVEKQILEEYIQTNPSNTYLQSVISKNAMKVGIKFGTGYGLKVAGNHLVKTSERFSALSSHYASGHKTTMRMQRSVRGKIAQREALMNMFGKSAKYGTSAARSKMAGSLIEWMGKKLVKSSFRPIGLLDALTPMSANPHPYVNHEEERIKLFVSIELKKYCDNNNNYHFIVNQQYISQG